ncbi:MAG TPA: class I SAM-dependent methyltransferase, partial [Acetobacteraceae bacterium]|nr:class I SAM-dependent methyltransferase [Acetobacteraceae bacterium]
MSEAGGPGADSLGAEFLAIDWATDAPPRLEACPNCGAEGPKPPALGVSWIETRRGKPMRRALFTCPACSCRYFEPIRLPDYHDWLLIGWPELHAQQGAGLWPIDSPLARIRKPRGSRYLEIGCGYGFALDFAAHARGWRALGIDPAPLAEIGCRLLGAGLRQGYFPAADPEILPWDVMAATEVIEHLARPLDLLREMRARLADDGVLLLTTPDGEAIRPDTPRAALAQLLAPELHMVFQTKASLARLLAEAGFAHAVIERDATSLVAFASPSPFALDEDIARQRLMFLDYLAARASALPSESDLGLGFAGRAMAEAANDGDFERATAMRDHLWSAIRGRYGLDLDALDHLPQALRALPLQRLRAAMPFNLATILFAEGMRRLGLGA